MRVACRGLAGGVALSRLVLLCGARGPLGRWASACLELHDGKGDRELLATVGVPRDRAHGALHLVRVLEDRQRLRRGRLARVVGVLARKVLLVDVDRGVLHDRVLDALSQRLDLLNVLLVLLHLFPIARRLLLLGRVDILRPATLNVQHARRDEHLPLRVDRVLGHLRNRLDLEDLRVAHDELALHLHLVLRDFVGVVGVRERARGNGIRHGKMVHGPAEDSSLPRVYGSDLHGATE